MATTTTRLTGIKLASVISPPPADIVIAQAATLQPIAEVAKMMGLEEGDFDPYGAHQGKVRVG